MVGNVEMSSRHLGLVYGRAVFGQFSREVITKSKGRVLNAISGRQGYTGRIQISCFRQLPIVGTFVFISLAKTNRVFCRRAAMTEEVSLEHSLRNADQLFDENHFQEVIDVLSKYPDPESPEIQWRKSRAYYSLSKSAKEKAEREKLIRQSYDLIQNALTKDDGNFAIHKWMAIVMDANAELDGIKARVSQLENMKHHIQKSLELNPGDPTTWHILGALEYGLADLPWIQRKIVSAIFASPPAGTYERALECFEKAESIKPGFYSSNWLMAGKCYMALKKDKEAKEYLEKAANCRVLNEDDKKSKEEATQLLKKLRDRTKDKM